ncbi:prominin-1-A-like isoform X4 [Acipenser oxyrinchus oxyrinchus]|uniref:Prominin-1-A-like isoform X4 n=1 Tax=Acipenser oxyrinchus oxyrinchus TaxID=40147 RepID=A0AAD8GJL1_ACIOX|nr:prominin-1-A-like isoform X4 [Acipenser oxyrinchus oxyrinchus]
MMGKAGLLLLMLWGCTVCGSQTSMQRSPQGTLDFGFVPCGVYETHAYFEPGPIGILFHLVHSFLHVVQPNPFPQDLITKVAQQKLREVKQEYKKAIYYEIGFIVCASLGVLFVLFMPLVGLCFCMCRCCDNCGGEMHQRQKKNADCRRGCFVTLLFVTSLIISAGVLCAYSANQNLSTQLKGVRKLVNSNFRDLKTFVNDTPAQIEYLAIQYNTAKNKVISDLDNIGPLLGSRIHAQLGKEVLPALDGALGLAGAMRETKEALENVSVSLEVLQEATDSLQVNLVNEQARLSNTLNDPACSSPGVSTTCSDIRSTLSQLSISANFSTLPNVDTELANVKNVLKTDLSNIVQKGYSTFNDTPDLVKNQTTNIVSGIKSMLDDIGSNITSFSKQIPVQDILANVTLYLSQSQSYVEDYYPVIDKYDFYRWMGCIVVCCMVALILTFNFLGLLCGTCGYDKHASPTTRGFISNTGGNLLMAGVGFSFLFSWVLMLIVMIAFVVGGNVEKLVCEPFGNRALFRVLDTPYLINPYWKNFLPGFLYQNPEIDLTFEKLYSNCKENKGIYTALQLDNILNISNYLNTSIYTKDVVDMFEFVNVNLSDMVLLDAKAKQNLLNFTNTGIVSINYDAYLAEINKGVTKVDLLSFANNLESQADKLPKGALENALKGHASSIRFIHGQQVVPLEQAMSTLNQSIRLLQRTTSDLPNKVNNVISAIDAAQNLITNNASLIITQETKKYMEVMIGYFKQYLDWVKNSMMMEVATCKPVANIVDTVEIVTCSFVVDSLNTFWFGLGCCTVFLIPSIIISVKLAKFFRRMDSEDVYDDMEIGNNGYHNEHLHGIQNPVMTSIPSYDTMTRFPRASAPPRQAEWGD